MSKNIKQYILAYRLAYRNIRTIKFNSRKDLHEFSRGHKITLVDYNLHDLRHDNMDSVFKQYGNYYVGGIYTVRSSPQ